MCKKMLLRVRTSGGCVHIFIISPTTFPINKTITIYILLEAISTTTAILHTTHAVKNSMSFIRLLSMFIRCSMSRLSCIL